MKKLQKLAINKAFIRLSTRQSMFGGKLYLIQQVSRDINIHNKISVLDFKDSSGIILNIVNCYFLEQSNLDQSVANDIHGTCDWRTSEHS